jgi:hypothetical protein
VLGFRRSATGAAFRSSIDVGAHGTVSNF